MRRKTPGQLYFIIIKAKSEFYKSSGNFCWINLDYNKTITKNKIRFNLDQNSQVSTSIWNLRHWGLIWENEKFYKFDRREKVSRVMQGWVLMIIAKHRILDICNFKF